MTSRWDEVAQGEGRAARYADAFAAAAAAGKDVHGEARLVHSLLPGPSRVLDAGCGTGRVAIRLAELGHDTVGVDVSEDMLTRARSDVPGLEWVLADLASLELPGPAFDLVVAAGNVIPLVATGTEATVVANLARHLVPGGLLVAGFGLDVAHLPLDHAPVDLPSYDAWCEAAGLRLEQRLATWDGDAYDGGGYAVSIHSMVSGSEESEFRQRYETHVGYVVAGDSAGALADMLPGVVPAVYEGLTLPQGPVTSRSIVGVYKKDGKWHGETVYNTAAGAVGLRSIWWLHEGEWRAAELENFPVEGSAGRAS